MSVIDTQTALEEARADWSLMLTELKKRGLPDDQRWPFPENIRQAKKRSKEVRRYLRNNPETLNTGGLMEKYRRHLGNVIGLYNADSHGRSESRKSAWILVFSIIAAVGVIATMILTIVDRLPKK